MKDILYRLFIILIMALLLTGCQSANSGSNKNADLNGSISDEPDQTIDFISFDELRDTLTNSGYDAGYGNTVPELYEGQSEFVGPCTYALYAQDETTAWIYHEADDGYVTKAGDLIITGNEEDYYYLGRRSFNTLTGLRHFPYGSPGNVWNGHILYVAGVDGSVLTCYEGNSIAPYQDLDVNDEDYIYRSSIDMIVIDFSTCTTLTEGKIDTKPIRAVIETDFGPNFTDRINIFAQTLLNNFNAKPDVVRNEIMSLYTAFDIDWCGLYIHYLLLSASE